MAGIPNEDEYDRKPMMPPPTFTPYFDDKKFDMLPPPPPPPNLNELNQNNFMGHTDQMDRVGTAPDIKPLQGQP